MDKQPRCAEAAEKAFARLGYDSRQNPLSSYQNRYSQTLNPCFISIADTHTGKDTVAEDRGLLDALESKQYGSFIWVNSSGEEFWEVGFAQNQQRVCQVVRFVGVLERQQVCRAQAEIGRLEVVRRQSDAVRHLAICDQP